MPETRPQIRTFPCRSDNIGVLMRDPATGACAAIDVPEAAAVLRALDETGWTLTDILVTHRHGDHVEGIPEVKARTRARVTAPARSGSAVPQVDATVREGDVVTVGSLAAAVWETPGHCDDHVTYWFEEAASRSRATPCSPSAAAVCWRARRRCCGARSRASCRCPTRP